MVFIHNTIIFLVPLQHHDDNTKVFLDVQTMCIQDDNSVKSKIGSGPVLADDFKKTQ